MALVTSDFVSALTTTVKGDFNRELERANAVAGWRNLAMDVKSTTETVQQFWLGAVPTMRDVTHGQLVLKDMADFDWSVTDKTWKAGFPVSRRAIEDDNLGWVATRTSQLAQEAAAHPGRLVFQQVRDGNTSAVTCFSGQNFFADAHVIGAATVDNLLTGGSTVAGAISAGSAAMMAFQDEEGEPMGITPNIIMVAPLLVQETYAALRADQSSPTTVGVGPIIPAAQRGGSWNVSGYTVVANPYLAGVSAVFLFSDQGGMKPFIFQERIAPSLEHLTEGSGSAIMLDEFIYSARARYAVAPADPRYAVRVAL